MVPKAGYRVPSMWKSILPVKSEFDKYIRFQANNGQQISFWNDIWCGNSSLND